MVYPLVLGYVGSLRYDVAFSSSLRRSTWMSRASVHEELEVGGMWSAQCFGRSARDLLRSYLLLVEGIELHIG